MTIFDAAGERQENTKVVSLFVEETAVNQIAIAEIAAAYDQEFSGVEVQQISNKDDLTVDFGVSEDLIDNDLDPELIQVDLFFGRDIAGVGEVSPQQFQSFVDRVITPRFPDGLTIFDAQGQFQDITGEVIEESSQVVSLVIEDTATNETAIKEIVGEYIEQFQQESVLTVVDEDIQAPNNSLCQDYTSDMFASIEVNFW